MNEDYDTIKNMATAIEALQNNKKKLEESLKNSSTAYARNTIPTSKDLSTSSQLSSITNQIESLRSKQIRNKWYGAGDEPVEKPERGMFMGALTALQRPMNAIIGAGQYALGKGSEQSLVSNVNEAMRKGLTAGDVLKQYGVSRAIQIPLGFALDVMFDPINWATAGTAALIPRVGAGLVKGGLKGGIKGAGEGLATGLTSGLAKKTATAMKFMPFAKTTAGLAPAMEAAGKTGVRRSVVKGAEKYVAATTKMGERALVGADKFDKIIGTTIYDRLGKGVNLPFYSLPTSRTAANVAEDLVSGKTAIPGLSFLGKAAKKPAYFGQTKGEKIVDFFKYSPQEAGKIADQQDKIINLAKKEGAVITHSKFGADFENFADFLDPGAVIKKTDDAGNTVNVAIRDSKGVLKPEYVDQIKVYNSKDNALQILEHAGVDYNPKYLEHAYKETPIGKTGVQWYDNVIDKLKNTTLKNLKDRRLGPIILNEVEKDANDIRKVWNSYNKAMDLKPFKAMLNAQADLIAFFKLAKVPMNASSHVVANIGNFFMGGMMGLPVMKPGYLKALKEANQLARSKLSASNFKEMFYGDFEDILTRAEKDPSQLNTLMAMANNNPTRFKAATGLEGRDLARKISIEARITRTFKGSDFAESKKILGKEWENIDDAIKNLSQYDNTLDDIIAAEGNSINKQILKEKTPRFETAGEHVARILKEAPIKRIDEYGSVVAAEMSNNQKLAIMKSWITKQASQNPHSPHYQLLNALVNSMPRWYEQIDQTFKLGTMNYLTKVGLTEPELLKISRTIPISKTDLFDPVIEGGEKLYKMTYLKAAEVATEAYMNYAAMPDFVRVMRAIPLAGAPFMCRSEDTEILTTDGWKKYFELSPKDEILNYNLDTKSLEWDKIKKVHVYDYAGNMYLIKSRSLDISASPEHDMIMAKRENIDLGFLNGKRKSTRGGWTPFKIKAKDIVSSSLSVVVGAENGIHSTPDKKHISDDWVRLIGWFVTDGNYKNKNKGCWYKKTTPGSYSGFSIYQSKPEYVFKIEELIKRLRCDVYRQIRSKDKMLLANYDSHEFNFKKKDKEEMDKYIVNKELDIKFLKLLTRDQLKILHETLIDGDGTRDFFGGKFFIQKRGKTLDTFITLTLMLGHSVGISKKEYITKSGIKEEIFTVSVNKKSYRQIKRNMPSKDFYVGKIWCPETVKNGTWIARRNNKIDITGNSFPYAMVSKTAKTAIDNPAVFNKIAFMINEMNAGRTPQEKAAMEEKYNIYLKEPSVVKIFGMWNTNVKNFVPYYTLNMLQPSDRSYAKDSLGGKIMEMTDKLPAFQDPAGAVLRDYFIQPWILSNFGEGESPQGMFGQPLYPTHDEQGRPIEAGLGTKAFYGGRTLAESLVPGSLAYLGGLNRIIGAGPGAVDLIPSYGARKLANATQGRGILGDKTKEDAMRKSIRALLGISGFPAYSLNTTYTTNKNN